MFINLQLLVTIYSNYLNNTTYYFKFIRNIIFYFPLLYIFYDTIKLVFIHF